MIAVVGGLLVGFVLLEVGLATLGGVHRDFAPVKATLRLNGGRQALCYVPGSDLEFPLDMRLPADRAWLAGVVEDWRVGHEEKWALDLVFDRYPECIAFAASRGSEGSHPSRDQTLLVLGDSFAFGEGLTGEQTLWSHLAAEQSSASVVSFASRGANIEEVVRQTRAALASPAPPEGRLTRAIYFYNLNDIMEQPPDDSAGPVSSERYLAAVDDARHILERWGPHSRFERLAAYAHVWWAFRHRAARRWVSSLTTSLYHSLYLDESNEAGRARTLTALRSLKEMLASRGVALDIVLYPLMAADQEGGYPFTQINEVILGWCRAEGLRCHDATQAVLEAGPLEELIVHPQDRHPNGRANRAMARFVVDSVL